MFFHVSHNIVIEYIALLWDFETIFMCNHTNTSWKIYISYQCCCNHNPIIDFSLFFALFYHSCRFCFCFCFSLVLAILRFLCAFFFCGLKKLFEFCTNVHFSFDSSDIVYMSFKLPIFWCIFKFINYSFCLSISRSACQFLLLCYSTNLSTEY